MIILFEPLKKAHLTLDKAVDRSIKDSDDLEVRDACIQRFEYTYELSIKTIKRYIEAEMPITDTIDQMNYRDLIRVAFEIGLIDQVEPWFRYREARNQTSHAYDEVKAQFVYELLPNFIEGSAFLINQLIQRVSKS